ncbi:hypothetical protein IWQ61_002052 [Dispira simplex]|nr:hypothetical protein IWQ61_002052 [Dispira simplex]
MDKPTDNNTPPPSMDVPTTSAPTPTVAMETEPVQTSPTVTAGDTNVAADAKVDAAPAEPTPLSEALNAKEKTLAEFLLSMDDHQPLIPDAVTDYYLARTGFECDDVRIKRLLALVAQKFITDVATDTFQYSRVQQMGTKERKYTKKDRRTVLTMNDLSQALLEYGINTRKPEYYA